MWPNLFYSSHKKKILISVIFNVSHDPVTLSPHCFDLIDFLAIIFVLCFFCKREK